MNSQVLGVLASAGSRAHKQQFVDQYLGQGIAQVISSSGDMTVWNVAQMGIVVSLRGSTTVGDFATDYLLYTGYGIEGTNKFKGITKKFLDVVKQYGPVTLVGYSLGGTIAWYLNQHYRQYVKYCAIYNPAWGMSNYTNPKVNNNNVQIFRTQGDIISMASTVSHNNVTHVDQKDHLDAHSSENFLPVK